MLEGGFKVSSGTVRGLESRGSYGTDFDDSELASLSYKKHHYLCRF